ncbi:citrate lyase [Advenella kashmirensis W13003]|uniref:Citrate lyase n=1 Tax=Advenella kashmirensis W13003 TaxID=1424334 RepID=V8QQH9_9BURK|nr:CoA ester lyase [Advenella kashmirensis]ETF01254.1 citrate lyase [Advenella kashmirensis W13003]
MVRSLLFVPADSEHKMTRALASQADALIFDLEDSVAFDRKCLARALVQQVIAGAKTDKQLWIRINALHTGHALDDLAAVVALQPFGIVLPKCEGSAILRQISHYLDAFERIADVAVGQTKILPIITETARALMAVNDYVNVTPRLWGVSWGAEDLSADIGSHINRVDGRYTELFRMARSMCLVAAAAADVLAIDTVCVDLDDSDILSSETQEAVNDGFTAKMLIHPRHIETVNRIFSPSPQQLQWAHSVVAAFEENPLAGTLNLNGKMIDQPHLRLAQRLLDKE